MILSNYLSTYLQKYKANFETYITIVNFFTASSNSVFNYHFQTQSHHIENLKPIYLTVNLT